MKQQVHVKNEIRFESEISTSAASMSDTFMPFDDLLSQHSMHNSCNKAAHSKSSYSLLAEKKEVFPRIVEQSSMGSEEIKSNFSDGLNGITNCVTENQLLTSNEQGPSSMLSYLNKHVMLPQSQHQEHVLHQQHIHLHNSKHSGATSSGTDIWAEATQKHQDRKQQHNMQNENIKQQQISGCFEEINPPLPSFPDRHDMFKALNSLATSVRQISKAASANKSDENETPNCANEKLQSTNSQSLPISSPLKKDKRSASDEFERSAYMYITNQRRNSIPQHQPQKQPQQLLQVPEEVEDRQEKQQLDASTPLSPNCGNDSVVTKEILHDKRIVNLDDTTNLSQQQLLQSSSAPNSENLDSSAANASFVSESSVQGTSIEAKEETKDDCKSNVIEVSAIVVKNSSLTDSSNSLRDTVIDPNKSLQIKEKSLDNKSNNKNGVTCSRSASETSSMLKETVAAKPEPITLSSSLIKETLNIPPPLSPPTKCNNVQLPVADIAVDKNCKNALNDVALVLPTCEKSVLESGEKIVAGSGTPEPDKPAATKKREVPIQKDLIIANEEKGVNTTPNLSDIKTSISQKINLESTDKVASNNIKDNDAILKNDTSQLEKEATKIVTASPSPSSESHNSSSSSSSSSGSSSSGSGSESEIESDSDSDSDSDSSLSSKSEIDGKCTIPSTKKELTSEAKLEKSTIVNRLLVVTVGGKRYVPNAKGCVDDLSIMNSDIDSIKANCCYQDEKLRHGQGKVSLLAGKEMVGGKTVRSPLIGRNGNNNITKVESASAAASITNNCQTEENDNGKNFLENGATSQKKNSSLISLPKMVVQSDKSDVKPLISNHNNTEEKKNAFKSANNVARSTTRGYFPRWAAAVSRAVLSVQFAEEKNPMKKDELQQQQQQPKLFINFRTFLINDCALSFKECMLGRTLKNQV